MRRLTPVILATLGLLALAGATGALQLLLIGFPLAAVAVLLVAAALAALTLKLHATSLTAKAVERHVKLLAGAVATIRATPTAPPAPPPATAVDPEPTPAEKLRSIDTYTPQPTASGVVKGRQAASTAPDPDAPFRLFSATHGAGNPDVTATSQRAIAVVGSDALAAALAPIGQVHRLHPGISAAELEHARPAALVVEEDAFSSGSWVGSLEPQGAQRLLELRVAMAWMRRNTGSIFVLPASGPKPMAADAMRADTTLVDEEFLASQADAPPSLLRTLAGYAAGHAAK